MREKHCEICKKSFSTMFRIQYKPNKNWVFVCDPCLILYKENNAHYKYGGLGKNSNTHKLFKAFKTTIKTISGYISIFLREKHSF